MGTLFGGDSGSGAIAAENQRERERLAKETEEIKVQEGQREAASRKVRLGGGGQRRLLSAKGFAGADMKTKLGQ